MSNNSISTYKFKPFEFTVSKKILDKQQQRLLRSGHRVVCRNANLFSFGDFYVQTNDVHGRKRLSTKQVLWKYCFDSGELKIIQCQNVPQKKASSPTILSGNIIIIYGGTGVPFSDLYNSNRMYLGNLANEYKENGMSFEELEVSGDVPLPLCAQGIVMDGKFIYSIDGQFRAKYEMDVHRFDLSTRKWELLHKSLENGQGPKPRCRPGVAFYKGRIYLFGGEQCFEDGYIFNFSKIYIFDVATKQWQLLQTKHDHRLPQPGYPNDRYFNGCVQCPDKPNLVYISGGLGSNLYLNDVWRFDFDTFQWEKLINCIMPQPQYLHSTAITLSGRMYCYGGADHSDNDEYSLYSHSNDIISAWITIPKLKVICWEAMVYYFKEQMFESSDECLKKIGLPQEYYERIIEARRIL